MSTHSSEDVLQKNKVHYDQVYSRVDVEKIVSKVHNLEHFLTDAIKTDTSWHGLYQGNFADQIRGKRVLELGCGDGLNALVMTALGAEVIANDISYQSEKIIREAASQLGMSHIQPITGDFADLSFASRSFDYVVGKAFLHHLTHETEHIYLQKTAQLLKLDGEARFFEPAENSQFLDEVRWMVPVPGRPSKLQKRAFAEWKAKDPHPERDNSSEHYVRVGEQFFRKVKIVPVGSIERFCRLMPNRPFTRRYRRWAHRTERQLPMWLRYPMARSQLIVYQGPSA